MPTPLKYSSSSSDFENPFATSCTKLTPTAAISITAWVWRETAVGHQTIVGKDWRTSYWLGITPEGRIRLYLSGAVYIDGNGIIPLQRWTYVSVTYDGAVRRLHLNGQVDLESTAFSGPVGISSAPLRLGADIKGYPFTGLLDEMSLCDRDLSAEEVKDLIFPEAMVSAGLVSAWNCSPSPSDPNRIDGSPRGFHARGVPSFEVQPQFGYLPRLAIPLTARTIAVDGVYGAAEYTGAEKAFNDFTRVYLVHSDLDLYVCMPLLPIGAFAAQTAAVMIDADASGTDFAGAGDFCFSIDRSTSTAVATVTPGTRIFPASAEMDPEYSGDLSQVFLSDMTFTASCIPD